MASAVETSIRKVVGAGISVVANFNRKRMGADGDNEYLTGIHTPMTGELTLGNLAVTGTIPPELDGRYLRIGPNPVGAVNPASYHWFTGDGMVHGVRLGGGKAHWYRNRWIRSTPVSTALGEAPAPGPRNGQQETVNTNVLGHAGKIWALVEAGGFPVELSDDLSTVAHNPFEGTLAHAFSAHPHLDPLTGEMHAICYKADQINVIHHVVVGTDGRVRRQEPIPVQHGPSIHDCALTARYVLVFDLPVTFSMKRLLAGFAFPYQWNPDHKARVGLMPRDGTAADINWCDVTPCYVFHPSNAFDTADGKVIVDVAVHDSMFADSTKGPDSQSIQLERWTIDPESGTVDRHVIDSAPQEFPRPDERRFGQPYRYCYAMALPEQGFGQHFATRLYKHDLESGTRHVHDFGPGRTPGEFVFVPRSATSAEDDGWLMGFVIDTQHDTTDLVVLNAQDFAGAPVASVHIPHRIPPGFHGNWVPA